MRPDVVVIHSPVGGGHKAAAMATAEAAAARGLSVTVLDLFEHAPKLFGQAYLAAHLAAQGAVPELYGTAYFGSNHRDGAFDPVRRGLDHLACASLVRHVVELDPRAVVATHHLPLIVLGRARRLGQLRAPLVGVVTDYGAHAVWAEPAVDALCVPCVGARKDVEAHGFDGSRVHLTGIPVRAAFERIEPAAVPRPGEPLRVLVTSGGFGVGPIRAIVRSFAGVDGVELTVVCGRAHGLEPTVASLARRLRLRAEVLGFERDMAARVAGAHIVVGKAGGLTVSEALVAGRSMIIAGAVPGNETFNARFVEEGGAGIAARPAEVGPVASRLRESGAIARMGRRARGLVPDRAAERVLDVALRAEGRVVERVEVA
jgi:processive 1,2-diacylglycerol beta-glucosyltransferase